MDPFLGRGERPGQRIWQEGPPRPGPGGGGPSRAERYLPRALLTQVAFTTAP